MTSAFDVLLDGPRTEVGLGDLAYDERMHVRRIRPTAGTDADPERRLGRITPIVYLAGDEREAAELFVEENRGVLDRISFDGSGRNPIESNVDRPIYDWILHALGRRRLDPYETVVIEYRSETDVTWCIGREAYVNRVDRRYSISHPDSARIVGTLPELFVDLISNAVENADARLPVGPNSPDERAVATALDDADCAGIALDADPIPTVRLDEAVTLTPGDIDANPRVAGSQRQPLDAFRADPRFDVEPTAVDDDIALSVRGFGGRSIVEPFEH